MITHSNTENNLHNQDNLRSHNQPIPETAMEIPIANGPASNSGENPNNSAGNVSSENLQPDSEPEAVTCESNPASANERGELQPWEIPVPESDEELGNTISWPVMNG